MTDCRTATPASVGEPKVPELVGVVAIGCNEGERLVRCLQSLVPHFEHVVYVDSGSTDGSVGTARSLGVHVVELDGDVPFSAARARNCGFTELNRIAPATRYVQFIDGDCELNKSWPDAAITYLESHCDYVAVCGRRRERAPDTSIFNRLIDMEWATSAGTVDSFGGDFMIESAVFRSAGGFNPAIVAGEEPELCYRLRRNGARIARIDCEMTLHDAAIHRPHQWWRRCFRTGFGGYEVWKLCGARATSPAAGIVRSCVIWGLIWPLLVTVGPLVLTASTSASAGFFLLVVMLMLWCLQAVRIAVRAQRQGWSAPLSLAYAVAMLTGKVAEFHGCSSRIWRSLCGQRSTVIEYKQS